MFNIIIGGGSILENGKSPERIGNLGCICQQYTNTKIQSIKTQIQKHKNTKSQKCKNTKVLKIKDIKTQNKY